MPALAAAFVTLPPVVADASAPVTDASAPPVEAQTAAEIRRHKVKIDGAEVEVDEPELLKSYERSKASYKRFEEAAKRAKEIEARESEFTETLKFVRDPKTRADALAPGVRVGRAGRGKEAPARVHPGEPHARAAPHAGA